MAQDTMPKSVAKWHSNTWSKNASNAVDETKADLMPGLNMKVPGSNGSEGITNEALISGKLINETIGEIKK